MTQQIDMDGRAAIVTAIVLGTIGVLSFIVQPGLLEGFVSALGLSDAQANDLAFWEMSGIAAATVMTAVAGRLVALKPLLTLALIMAALGNALSAVLPVVDGWLAYARLMTGLGEGVVISLSFSLVGLTSQVRRNLAYYLVLLLSYGAVGLWAMPSLIGLIGLRGIFLMWAGMSVLTLLLLRFLPHSLAEVDDLNPHAVQLALPLLLVGLVAVLIYNTAIGLAWANLFLIGLNILDDVQSIANALLISQFVAIGGALMSVYLAERLGRWGPVSIGILGGAACMGLLLMGSSYWLYVVAVCGFNFLWNMVLPFILDAIGDMDEQGRMMAPAISMQMIGLGFGPFVAARILGGGGDFALIEMATMIMLVGAFVILAVPMAVHQRRLSGRLARQGK